MPLPTKFFKVTLPLATAATATIITAYLVSSFTKELSKNKEENPALENIELKSKEFEEEIIQNDQESEKDEKSASDPKQNNQDALDQAKSKEALTSTKDAAKMLEQAESAVKQLASQGGDGSKEKNLKIEGKAQISSSEGEERVQHQDKDSEQSSSLPKAKGNEEAVQSAAKAEEDSSKELIQGQEENESGTDKGMKEEVSIPSDATDQEHGFEEAQVPAHQDMGEKTLQEDDVSTNLDDDQKEDMELDGRDSSDLDSTLYAEDSEPAQASKGENGESESRGQGGSSDSDEGSAEINEDTVKRLVELKDEMSDYKDKIQALLRSIG